MFGSKAGNGGHARYDESIVLTGISGRFPKAANMAEFQRNLLTGVDMTTETKKRWNCKGVQGRMGLLNCLDKFDSSFFNLTPRQADQLDPQARMLMEASFEAILDAGTIAIFILALACFPMLNAGYCLARMASSWGPLQ